MPAGDDWRSAAFSASSWPAAGELPGDLATISPPDARSRGVGSAPAARAGRGRALPRRSAAPRAPPERRRGRRLGSA